MAIVLEDQDVESIREICLLNSFADAADLCAIKLVNDAQRQAALDDLAEWEKIRLNVTDIVSTRYNEVSLERKKKRRILRWAMRQRLGLPPVSEEELEMEALEGSASGGGAMRTGAIRVQTGRKKPSQTWI